MANQYNIDFTYINQCALINASHLITQWLPNGDFRGDSYFPLNPTRDDKHKGSFVINCKTGLWSDFATGDKGSGLISLYAYINGITPVESANILTKELNLKGDKNMNILVYKEEINYETILLPKNYEYKGFSNATNSWAYRDMEGRILIITDRFDLMDGSKKVLPRCFVKNLHTNEKGWLQKKLLSYNPLYNLENFQKQQNLPVLIVEGEKTCEAAKNIYGHEFWCTTWLGGANSTQKVDVNMIHNRKVYLLPDNDDAGRKAMNNIANMLKNNNTVFIINYPQNEFPTAWDVADELPSGWTHSKLEECIMKTTNIEEQQKTIKETETIATQQNEITNDVKPYPEEVDGLELIDSLVQLIKKYIVVTHEEAIAIAYWILQTYNVNMFTYAPRLLIISPEKRCGKSTLLRLLELLCYRAYPTGNCTASVLYKIIEKEQPTVLIDEADTFFGNNSEIKNIINTGFQKRFGVARSCGKNFENIKQYNVFALMAVASINNLPDTIMDRGIKINMRRKLPTEHVELLRDRIVFDELNTIKQKCKRFMLDYGKQAGEHMITNVKGLNDRACDVWEGMIGIASIIGDEARLIKAAQQITLKNAEDTESLKNLLLKHILQIFINNHFFDVSSSELVSGLVEIEDSPWLEYNNGRAITPHKLAFLLKEYKITTFQKNVNGHNTKHYSFEAFADIFARYIPKEFKQAMHIKEGGLDSILIQED